MIEFSHHEACPNCGSRDNLGVWEDGHKWCFGCRFRVRTTGWNQYVGQTTSGYADTVRGVCLPSDFTQSIIPVGLDWLRKYGLTKREITKLGIGWSTLGIKIVSSNVDMAPLLVLPVYDNDKNLVLWQGRNFGEIGPKYYTKGMKEAVIPLIGGQQTDYVVVVEDYVSSIKVGRQASSMALFGSNLTVEKALLLSKLFKHLRIWLDYDKTLESFYMVGHLAPYFESVKPIITENDPKDYTDLEISKWLHG